MKKSIVMLVTAIMILMPIMSGCATNKGPEYDGSSYDNIKRIQIGRVISERPVVVKDDGLGTFIGAITGVVLGSFVGGGRASSLGALGGGLAGGYAGSEAGKANAQELTVELNDTEVVVIVVKGDNIYKAGDRIKIIKDGNKVASVEKLESLDQ
ncbi:glycine zipper 2TM domain-containing protein [Campylobacterota bacterium]